MAATWGENPNNPYNDPLLDALDQLSRVMAEASPKPRRSRKERLLMASLTTGPKGALDFINRCFERRINGNEE